MKTHRSTARAGALWLARCTAAVAFVLGATAAAADVGDCGQPVTNGASPVAADCLGVLQAAVALIECDECICDINGSGTTTASDALVCLSYAVGLPGVLACTECAPDDSDTHKNDYVGPLPTLSVDPPAPTGLDTATVTVDAPGATGIDLVATGQGCGAIIDQSVGGALLQAMGEVGRFGACDLIATVSGGDAAGTHFGQFTVEPSDLVLPDVEVRGGVFFAGPLPAATPDGGGLNVVSIQTPPVLINGGLATVFVEISDPDRLADVAQVLVGVETANFFAGHWVAPVVVDNGRLRLQISLIEDYQGANSIISQLRAGGVVNTSTGIFVQIRDTSGEAGNPYEQDYGIEEVGNGDVQVSLSWDTPTDVDLHLVEPDGFEIYYSYALSPNWGWLDLDSNAGCDIDGINNENIQYSRDVPPGEYTVRVAFYWGCEDELPASYTVNVNNCGERTAYTGEFASGTDGQGGRGAGRTVATFIAACTYQVTGKARYENFAQTSTGLAGTSTMNPIRFAKVEVRRDLDDEVLATGSTGQDGTFDVRFENDGLPGYYVLVIAEHDEGYIDQRVVNGSNLIYAVRSQSYDEQIVPDNKNIVVDAMRSGNGPAPAFNIFDQGVTGGLLLHEINGNAPPHLTWLWTNGQQGTCSSAVSCYQRKKQTISVLSIPADPDEYDDLVLLHEYGHFFQANYSRDNSNGGAHSSTTRVDPRLAWSEGSATFVGSSAKRTSLYIDTTSTGVGVLYDLDTPGPGVPVGTSNMQQNGTVSENVVAAIMWDLADSTNENLDDVSNRLGTFTAMQLMRAGVSMDRGVIGADLVDFLDAWFCAGLNNRGDTGTGVQAVVSTLNGFPYDFSAVCN